MLRVQTSEAGTGAAPCGVSALSFLPAVLGPTDRFPSRFFWDVISSGHYTGLSWTQLPSAGLQHAVPCPEVVMGTHRPRQRRAPPSSVLFCFTSGDIAKGLWSYVHLQKAEGSVRPGIVVHC